MSGRLRAWFQTDKEAALRGRAEVQRLLNWIIDQVIKQSVHGGSLSTRSPPRLPSFWACSMPGFFTSFAVATPPKTSRPAGMSRFVRGRRLRPVLVVLSVADGSGEDLAG
jgi:hypothetical protein